MFTENARKLFISANLFYRECDGHKIKHLPQHVRRHIEPVHLTISKEIKKMRNIGVQNLPADIGTMRPSRLSGLIFLLDWNSPILSVVFEESRGPSLRTKCAPPKDLPTLAGGPFLHYRHYVLLLQRQPSLRQRQPSTAESLGQKVH